MTLLGQEFKFGIKGGDNESGFGLNHIENIDDSNPTFTIHSQWGSINPGFYYVWNFDLMQVGVDGEPQTVITTSGTADRTIQIRLTR